MRATRRRSHKKANDSLGGASRPGKFACRSMVFGQPGMQ